MEHTSAMQCYCCQAPWHPSSGFLLPGNRLCKDQDVPVCGACFRSFVAWLHGHLNRRWSKVSFYDNVGNSGQLVPREA